MTSKSYGLNGLDTQILERLDTAPGFFFEAGANDGIAQSNTKALEEFHGWKGLLVEPIPHKFMECAVNRRTAFIEWGALTALDDPRGTLKLSYCNLMTVTQAGEEISERELKHLESGRKWLRGTEEIYEFEAPALTISGLLSKYGNPEVGLLSLDLEGYELQALRGLDLARHRPKHMVIEIRAPDGPAINALLADHYTETAKLTNNGARWDAFYTRK